MCDVSVCFHSIVQRHQKKMETLPKCALLCHATAGETTATLFEKKGIVWVAALGFNSSPVSIA